MDGGVYFRSIHGLEIVRLGLLCNQGRRGLTSGALIYESPRRMILGNCHCPQHSETYYFLGGAFSLLPDMRRDSVSGIMVACTCWPAGESGRKEEQQQNVRPSDH